VRQVVRCPCGQKLPYRHRSKRRMHPFPFELRRLQIDGGQGFHITLAQRAELLEQCAERFSRAIGELCFAVERIKLAAGAMLQNYAQPRQPIGAITVD